MKNSNMLLVLDHCFPQFFPIRLNDNHGNIFYKQSNNRNSGRVMVKETYLLQRIEQYKEWASDNNRNVELQTIKRYK
jgi:hypothetical protein